jgi:hypothetical protein
MMVVMVNPCCYLPVAKTTGNGFTDPLGKKELVQSVRSSNPTRFLGFNAACYFHCFLVQLNVGKYILNANFKNVLAIAAL